MIQGRQFLETVASVDSQSVRSRDGFRRRTEKLVEAAAFLAPNDRFLIEQVFQHGLPIRSIARQMSRPNENIYRLVKKLVTRIESTAFRFVIGHLSLLPKHLKPTAELAVLKGHSQREIAKLTGKSLHQIRQELTMIQGLQAF